MILRFCAMLAGVLSHLATDFDAKRPCGVTSAGEDQRQGPGPRPVEQPAGQIRPRAPGVTNSRTLSAIS